MAMIRLALDVHCDAAHTDPVYRVYVNQDLYTERTWIWPSYNVFIREHLVAELDQGQHQVRIEKVSGQGNFTVHGFTVNGADTSVKDLTFMVN
jgi:hypothetical protein